MKEKIAKITFVVFGVALLVYLAWPAPQFPNPLPGFHTSTEPADQETPLRRGYYTNSDRTEVMSHYVNEFKWGIRLNYPPEEAQTIIRDQTHATYLEEIVHPMRESIFITGNDAQPGKSLFQVDGQAYKSKVIVRYVDSNIFVRLASGILTLSLIWILGVAWIKTVKELKNYAKTFRSI